MHIKPGQLWALLGTIGPGLTVVLGLWISHSSYALSPPAPGAQPAPSAQGLCPAANGLRRPCEPPPQPQLSVGVPSWRPSAPIAAPDHAAPAIVRAWATAFDPSYSVLIVWLRMQNDTPNAVKDVPFTCALIAPSGTVLGSRKGTVYRIVPAHAEIRTEPGINLGFIPQQVATISCSATGWVAAE